jgi:hypothetical protein
MHKKDQYLALPAAYLKLFVQYAAATGLDLEPLLEEAGLGVENLLDTKGTIDFETVRRVLGRVTLRFGEGWHLALGERFTVPAHGALGFAVVTAPDVRSAIDVLLRYLGIRGPFLWPSGAVEGEEYVIRFYESQAMGEERRMLVELALLSMQELIERPLGHTLRGARLAFALPKPAYHEALSRSFHARLGFDARRHSLRLPLAWLDQPCAMHDDAMHRYLLARCEEECHSGPHAQPGRNCGRPDSLGPYPDPAPETGRHLVPGHSRRGAPNTGHGLPGQLPAQRQPYRIPPGLPGSVQLWAGFPRLVRRITGAVSQKKCPGAVIPCRAW